jgi:tetratricopeptide (TPR) repeat protein
MDDIFISYSRKDKAFATRLHEALKARQRAAWVDLEDIPPTAEWREKIKAGIEGARAFVFVLSPDSMASLECLKEIGYAATSHKRLIPLVCREVDPQSAPEALGKLNWIFLREQDDFDKGLDTLLTAVDTDLEWVDAHTSLLEKATEWDRKGRHQSLLLRSEELKEAEGWQVKSAEKEPKPTELMASFIVSSRQGETRRQRKLLFGVSLALVVALGLGGGAWYQRNVAEKRGQVAEKAFLRLTYDLRDGLKKFPGTADMRRNFIEGNLEGLRELDAIASGKRVARELATNYRALGEVQVELNDYENAESAYKTSAEICKQLIKVNPKEAFWRRDLAVSYLNLALVMEQLGKREQALSELKLALGAAQEAARLDNRWADLVLDIQNEINRLSMGF